MLNVVVFRGFLPEIIIKRRIVDLIIAEFLPKLNTVHCAIHFTYKTTGKMEQLTQHWEKKDRDR